MRTLFSLLLSLTIFFSTIPKAQAIVGVAMADKKVRVMGGMVAAYGAGSYGAGFILMTVAGNSVLSFALMSLGFTTGVVGLVVLDSKTADMKFSEITEKTMQELEISLEERDIYNSEVDQLNLIKEEIESQLGDSPSPQEVETLWKEYQGYLSAETQKVASKIIVKAFSK